MSRPPLTVGIIANPASGRDVRRLTANAGLFSSTDKVSVIQRLLAAFGATGIERVLLPTDMTGIAAAVQKNSHSRQARESHWPALEFLDITLRQSVADTRQAARLMAERGVSLIAVLGGDGTHKAVAGEIGDIPMLTLSTGTNNAFPELREAASAGLAGGLYASGRIPRPLLCAATSGWWCASRAVACARSPWWMSRCPRCPSSAPGPSAVPRTWRKSS